MTRTRQERSTQFGGNVVTLGYRAKRRAIGKLHAVYGVSLSDKVPAPKLSEAIARVLEVSKPDSFEASARMIVAFAREVPEVLEGEDLVEKLKARFPFQPLQLSPQMKYALERAREFHELGSGSDGGNHPVPHSSGCSCELCAAIRVRTNCMAR